MILSWALTTWLGWEVKVACMFCIVGQFAQKQKACLLPRLGFYYFYYYFIKYFLKFPSVMYLLSLCIILLKIFLVLQLPLWWIYITLGGIETSSVDRHTTSETLVCGKYHFTIIIIKLIYPYLKKNEYLFFSSQ